MSYRYSQILHDGDWKRNSIPSGRQLHRSPLVKDKTDNLDSCSGYLNADCVEPQTHKSDDDNRSNNFNSPETNQASFGNILEAPNSMLKGMKGYRLTPEDEDFIKKLMIEKEVKKLQRDLEEVQKLLKREVMALEMSLASKDKVQAELNQLPSCEALTEWAKVIVEMTSPLTEVTDMDAKSLLAMLTKENIQRATEEKKLEIRRLEKMVKNKRRKEAEERGQLEKQIASEREKMQGLMIELSSLKSEFAQLEEANKALEMQMSTEDWPKLKVKAERVDTPEKPQADNSQVKQKGRKKAVKSAEKLQDTTNQSTPTKEETKQKSGAAGDKSTKMVKVTRGRQRKKEQESVSQESTEAGKGRKKPTGSVRTTASQPRNQRKVKTVERQPTLQSRAPIHDKMAAESAEDEHNTGLRRSKRIANKK
ncbi:uncharacterized protein LOC115436416 [Sphaeramia orbicularis]|uniref:uncharacterized protein LOC115436416 n=1 Tax=Sphaeramia orbicularis TaxID=375764 RepID=UPI00117F33E6|nr:uncharacterized protein LOC115436416 [Sphaeramia orbicularis]